MITPFFKKKNILYKNDKCNVKSERSVTRGNVVGQPLDGNV